MRLLHIALSLLSAPVLAQAPGCLTPSELTRRIDEHVTAHVTATDFSGTVLLAKDGEPLFHKSYGLANREWLIPTTLDTRFRIASITKPFTATLIMQLREQGKLTLDDSICLHVAGCPDAWKPV